VLGNLIPALLCLPFAGVALAVYAPERPLAPAPFLWMFGFLAAGWTAMNLFGLYDNAAMRAQIGALWARAGGDRISPRWFVGMARPAYRSLLDPHEDVGFLVLGKDRLEFFGETVRVAVARPEITAVRYRPNLHTWVFLGRWISVEGETAGVEFRLLIEPRERGTLLGNLLYGRRLRAELEEWRRAGVKGVLPSS
jgi:hypothetical protein